MNSASVLALLSLAPFVFWLALACDRSRRWPTELDLGRLGEAKRSAAPELPAVAVLIPARNEEETLPRSLRSLLDQQPAPTALRVIDDSSDDGTVDLLRELAAESPSLEWIEAGPCPPGWSGKIHALARGVAAVEERFPEIEWLLFTDADIVHRPGSVGDLVAVAEAEGRDLVSVMARLRTETFWERLLVPPFVYFFQLLYPFRRVGDRASRVAAAAGGCVLIRRAALERAGGLEAIHEALIDDVTLARTLKATGSSLWLGLDAGIESIRPYRALRELWQMVSRNAFVQLKFRWDWLLGVELGLALFFVMPPLLLALSLALGYSEGRALVLAAAGLSAAAWLLQGYTLWGAVRHHRVPLGFAATLPLAAVFYGAMTLSSALGHLGGRTSSWRGRTYSSHEDRVSQEGQADRAERRRE